jgi:hypothetical protein
MTERTISTITLLLVLMAVGSLALWRTAWGLMEESAVDITTGDYRNRVYVCGVPVKSEIWESLLSREVRRLGMGVPAEREWKHMGRHFGGVYRDSSYGFMMGPCENLVVILDETSTPDEERKAILEKLMKMLRTEEPDHVRDEAFLLTIEIADKHNLHVLNPSVEDYYRALLKDKENRTE